jgi:NADPH-dependent ferric siderophore reductase
MSAVPPIRRTGQYAVTVAEVRSLSPRMRRITLAGAGIAEQDWPLACDIAVVLDGPDGREVRRRYTVRSTAGEHLVLDAVLHGHGPGSSWAAAVTAGDQVTFFGPRGQIELAPVPLALALTDESGLPAVAALAEAAAAAGRAIRVVAEVPDDTEHYPLPDGTEVSYRYRAGQPPGQPDLLRAAIAGHAGGAGYGYLLGESRAVVALREALVDFGLPRVDIYAKGYWNLNARRER